jgi:CheY-like chemotaxis protein
VRILVVDDSAAVRARVVAMIREIRGVSSVEEASDGAAAMEIAAGRVPHLVLLDIHMPNRDGFAVLPRLKELEGHPLVMVLTNDSSDRHRQRCVALGADLFFDKSADFDRALEVIASLADERARAAESG